MEYVILSLIFGVLPQTIYFWQMIVYTREQKQHRLKLFMLLFFVFGVSSFARFNIDIYLISMVLIYVLIKRYIFDITLTILSSGIMFIISIACYVIISNYFVAITVYSVLIMGLPYFVCKYIKKCYIIVLENWNRTPNNKIKSITIRVYNSICICLSFSTCAYLVYLAINKIL